MESRLTLGVTLNSLTDYYMEVLFPFIFRLFKIAILASVYATLVVLIIITIGYLKPAGWFDKMSRNKLRLWFRTGFIISIILFCYIFSYWGNHGSGDISRVPVGHGKYVEQLGLTRTYIRANDFKFEALNIGKFAIAKNFLFAKNATESTNGILLEYVVWNLKTGKADFLRNYSDIDSIAQIHGISEAVELHDFDTHYKLYWSGWRFWLLP